jgi:hypothetical protein
MNTFEFKMKGTIDGSGVYLRINKNYVATVRNLESLCNYLRTVGDVDNTFGIIESDNGTPDFYIRMVIKIVKAYKRYLAKKHIGTYVEVYRNQGLREGYVVAANENGFIVEYVMPNGTSALNILKDLSRTENYKSISYKKAFSSRDFGSQISKADLINNPQK